MRGSVSAVGCMPLLGGARGNLREPPLLRLTPSLQPVQVLPDVPLDDPLRRGTRRAGTRTPGVLRLLHHSQSAQRRSGGLNVTAQPGHVAVTQLEDIQLHALPPPEGRREAIKEL